MAERLPHIPPNEPGSGHEHTGDLPIEKPNLPQELGQFNHLEPVVTKSGAHRVYGVDSDGKKHALKHDDILEAYGHDPKERESGDRVSPTSAEAVETADVHEEFKAAVETDSDGAKDKTFREWLKETEQKKANRWYRNTKTHAEGPDDINDSNIRLLDDDELKSFRDKSHEEALNKREGKDSPTDDDVEYYRWLKNAAEADDTASGATDPTGGTDPKDPAGGDPKGPEPTPPKLIRGVDPTGLSRSEQAFLVANTAFDYQPTPDDAPDELKEKIKQYNEDNISLLRRFGQTTDDYARLQGIIDAAHVRGHLKPEDQEGLVLDSHRVKFDPATKTYVSDPEKIRLDRDPKTALEQAEQHLDRLREKYEAQRSLVDAKIMQTLYDAGFNDNDVSDEMLAQAAGTEPTMTPHGISFMGGNQRKGESGLISEITAKRARDEVRGDFTPIKKESEDLKKKPGVHKWLGRGALTRTIAKRFSNDAATADRLIKDEARTDFNAQLAEIDRRQEENHSEQQLRIANQYLSDLGHRDASEVGGQKRHEYPFDPGDVTSAHFEGATRTMTDSAMNEQAMEDLLRVREEQQPTVPSPRPPVPPRAPSSPEQNQPAPSPEQQVTREQAKDQAAAMGLAYAQLYREKGEDTTMHEVVDRANQLLRGEAPGAPADDDTDETQVRPANGSS